MISMLVGSMLVGWNLSSFILCHPYLQPVCQIVGRISCCGVAPPRRGAPGGGSEDRVGFWGLPSDGRGGEEGQ